MTERLLFADLKVLDVGSWIAAPVATTILADYGAQVIKICLLYTSPSPRDKRQSRMPSSA